MKAERVRSIGAMGVAVAGAGTAAGAATAAACCVGPVVSPLIVTALGVGGSVAVAGLTPYAPYLLIGSLIALGAGFRLAYRRPAVCGPDGARAKPPLWLRLTLWGASAVWLASAVVTVTLSA